jgi:two-component system, cell cycle response regulator
VTRTAAEPADVGDLRRLYEQQSARIRELELSQRQLELYAEDLQRTFSQLRRQLAHMNELHNICTVIGSILEPSEVVDRTVEALGRIVEHDVACLYLVEDGSAVRQAARGVAARLPPRRVKVGHGPIGKAVAGADVNSVADDRTSMTVVMRTGGSTVGALYLARFAGDPLADDDRKLVELVAAEAAAAIQNARLYKETQRLATTDPQTGLFNYRYFLEMLAMEAARARRLGYPVGLLMLDVDDFKRVNDTYGHLVGDQVLREVAMVLRRSLRRTDVAVRYGGEEFAVVLPGLGAPGVRAVGEKLRRAVRGLPRLERDGKEAPPITISVGGVSQSPTLVDSVSLVREADAALYEAKRRGKDVVHVLPSEADETAGRSEGEEDAQAPRAAG